MNIGVYYHVLESGIVNEKGKKKGKLWRVGERKRIKLECQFWEKILRYVELEMEGVDSSDILFVEMKDVIDKIKINSYLHIYNKREELMKATGLCEYSSEYVYCINELLENYILEIYKKINQMCGKSYVYRTLDVMHNWPRVFLGKELLGGGKAISFEDAIKYASWRMTDEMKLQCLCILKKYNLSKNIV